MLTSSLAHIFVKLKMMFETIPIACNKKRDIFLKILKFLWFGHSTLGQTLRVNCINKSVENLKIVCDALSLYYCQWGVNKLYQGL